MKIVSLFILCAIFFSTAQARNHGIFIEVSKGTIEYDYDQNIIGDDYNGTSPLMSSSDIDILTLGYYFNKNNFISFSQNDTVSAGKKDNSIDIKNISYKYIFSNQKRYVNIFMGASYYQFEYEQKNLAQNYPDAGFSEEDTLQFDMNIYTLDFGLTFNSLTGNRWIDNLHFELGYKHNFSMRGDEHDVNKVDGKYLKVLGFDVYYMGLNYKF